MKIHKRLFALLLVFALVIGLLPSVLADNEPGTAESTAETLEESPQEESPAIAPPTQSILESDEAVEGSEVEAEIEAPTSMDGETLTRTDNGGVMLLGGGGTILPEPQTVTIPGNEVTYATMENVWKHWWATITKVHS